MILSSIFLILNTTYEIRTSTIKPPSHKTYVMHKLERILYSLSFYDVRKKNLDLEECNHWGQGGYRGMYRYRGVNFCDKQVYPENVDMDICFAYNQKKRIPDDYACTNFAWNKKFRGDEFHFEVDKDYREYYFDITISFLRVIIFTILPFLVFFIIRKIVLWVSRGT